MSDRAGSATDWLLSFSDPVRGVGWNPASGTGLEWNVRRTRLLLDIAGAHDRTMSIVLVAGTKGKGSTAAMTARLLATTGRHIGLSTKPHLQEFRERIRVDGVAISSHELERRAAQLREVVDALTRRVPEAGNPTTFELATVLALGHYAGEGCDAAVLEVGLGGRYDATNATDPLVSVITAISHDHTRELGSRLSQIAREKAGIMRPGRVAVVAPQPDEARRTLRGVAASLGTPLREVRALATRAADELGLPLKGEHQRANASAALAAVDILAQHDDAFAGVRRDGSLRDLGWPGRFEVSAPNVVLDGAHNDGSAEALAATLRREFPRRKVRFVIGLMRDKDARAVVRALLPLARSVDAVRAPGPRGLEPEAIVRLARGVPARAHEELAAAIAAARADAGERDVVCVTGSLSVVGQARDALGLGVAERLW
ncbi:MAG TPA: Mur ligase family protein [Candidatus Limnocylindria bacterium]